MKIMVFENGEPGRRVSIPGENVLAELEDLLCGPIVWESITPSLQLVTRANRKAAKLPDLYGIYRSGRVADKIRGNAAVVKVGPWGDVKDISADAAETARLLVRPLDPAGY